MTGVETLNVTTTHDRFVCGVDVLRGDQRVRQSRLIRPVGATDTIT